MSLRKPWEIGDESWSVVEPLPPKQERRYWHPGRKRIEDRKTLQGCAVRSLHGYPMGVPATGVGLRPGPTCWRRLAEWQAAGVLLAHARPRRAPPSMAMMVLAARQRMRRSGPAQQLIQTGSSAKRTIAFPVFAPVSMPVSAAGTASIP
ncbi:transposase [Streptomyces sp. NBC_01180]|uniref:transposase n=1 Tax=unclassified Streptomyces TaxID=2593676 RepID=UPI0038645E28